MPLPGKRACVRAAYVAAVVLLLGCFAGAWDARTGFTRLIRFGDAFDGTRVPELRGAPIHVWPGSHGYDGQFYVQMALHPACDDPAIRAAMDAPDYRFHRILLPWIAAAVGGGDTWRTLNAYAVLNVVFWLGLAGLLLCWLPPVDWQNFARWAGCLYGVGAVASIQLALPDLPAAVLIVLAVALAERGRNLPAAAALGAAALTRDVSLVAATLRLDTLRPGRTALLRWISFGIIALSPFVLWLGYLRLQGAGPAMNPGHNFSPPFAGLLYEARSTLGYLAQGKLYNALAFTGLLVQLGTLVAVRAWQHPLWRAALPYGLLTLVLGIDVWYAEPGAAYRVVLPVAIAFNVLLPRNRASWPLLAAGNLSVIISLDYITRWV